jgi:hypothetical protein
MQKIEFDTLVPDNGILYLPKDKMSELKAGGKIHVVVYAESDINRTTENEQWNQLGVQSFFKDHSEEDNIYDELYADK